MKLLRRLRLRRLRRKSVVMFNGCPWCRVPSPHFSPHADDCPWMEAFG